MERTAVKAYRAMRYLVYAAQHQQLVTYAEFCKRVGVSSREIGPVASYIRDEFCLPRNLPLLNLLIVKTQDEPPPTSFFVNHSLHMSKTERATEFRKALRKVYRYQDWDALLTELEIAPLPV